MKRGEDVLLDQPLGDDDRVLEVITPPGHEGGDDVPAEGQLAQVGAGAVGQDLALDDRVALADDGPLGEAGILVGPEELGQDIEVGRDLVILGLVGFVDMDENPLGVDEGDGSRSLADDDVARTLGHKMLHARAHQRGDRPQERDGLPLHVGAHKGAVGVVVLQERDEGGGKRNQLLGGDVDVVDLLPRQELEVARLPGGDELVDETAVLVDPGVGLGDIVVLFFPGGQVVAVRLDDGKMAGALPLQGGDRLAHVVLLDDIAILVLGIAGMEDLDVIDDPAVLDLAVGGFDEAVLVDPGIGAERGNQSDVRALRRLDRADPAVMGGLDVADLEARPLPAQAAGTEGAEAPLMGHLGQAVDLVHKLGQLRGSEEFLQGGDDGLGIDEVLGHGRGQVQGDRHLFLDRPLHPGQADPEGVLDKLAHRTNPAVAEVVDVVHVPFAPAEIEEIGDDVDIIPGLEDFLLQ